MTELQTNSTLQNQIAGLPGLVLELQTVVNSPVTTNIQERLVTVELGFYPRRGDLRSKLRSNYRRKQKCPNHKDNGCLQILCFNNKFETRGASGGGGLHRCSEKGGEQKSPEICQDEK